MRNRVLALTRTAIPYVKELNALTGGSIVACILMQQLDYWFARYPDGFFKFLAPCPSHRAYRHRSSWTEEIGISEWEFREAFKRIGATHKSKRLFDTADDPFRGQYYASYNDRMKGLTYYFRNHELVDAMLDKLVIQTPPVNEETSVTQMKKLDLRGSGNLRYGNEESSDTEMKNPQTQLEESTEDITKDITKGHTLAPLAQARPALALKADVDDIFEFWRVWLHHPDAQLIPDSKRDKHVRARRKEGYTAAYIKLAVIGCSILPHNMGINDRHRKFDDLELICRTSEKLEGFHDEAVRNGIDDPDAWAQRMIEARGHQAKVAAEQLAPETAMTVPITYLPPDPASPWGRIVAAIKPKLSTQAFDTWFRPLTSPGKTDDGAIIVYVPNPVVRDWIMAKYVQQLGTALGDERIDWRLARNGNKPH